MMVPELMELLVNAAKDYREDASASISRNSHLTGIDDDSLLICEHEIDAVLVDFINHIACMQGCDYALTVDDLDEDDD